MTKSPRKRQGRNRKRANGEGSYYQLSDGRWQCSVVVGHHHETGKPIRRTRTRKTRADCLAAMKQLQREIDDGDAISATSLTVAQFLDRWIEDTVRPNVSPSTHNSYRRQCKNHIKPHLGTMRLRELAPIHLSQWLAKMERGNVGSCTRKHVFRVLTTALNHAANELQLIRQNPCLVVKAPRHNRREIRPFTANEVRRIIDDSATSPYHALYVIAFHHGLRYGELTGLTWDDVDFGKKLIHVRRQLRTVNGQDPELVRPKTASSIRTIELTERSLEALNDRRQLCLREQRMNDPTIFAGVTSGSYLWPQVFYRSNWTPMLKRLGIDHRGFHHTRHTFASLALGAGVPVHVVSRILGHSSAAMTLNVYAHLMPTDQKQATDAIGKMFG